MLSKFLHSTVPVFIHAQFIYGHWHVCVNGCRTSSVMYTSSWHSFTLNICTHLANDWYGRAQSINALVALHDTPVCLCHGQLTFPHSHTVPLHGLSFPNKATNKISAHAQPNTSPHLMVTFTNTCHMLHSLHQPSWAGGGTSHDLQTDTHIMCMRVYMHMCIISCWSPHEGMMYRQNQKGEETLWIGYQALFQQGKTAILWKWSLFSVQCQGAWRQNTSFFSLQFHDTVLIYAQANFAFSAINPNTEMIYINKRVGLYI